jgi:hypothetical protein
MPNRMLIQRFSHTETIAAVVMTKMFKEHMQTVRVSNASLFPWLSVVSNAFDKWRFLSLRVRYQPLCAATTDGLVGVRADFGSADRSVSDMTAFAQCSPANYSNAFTGFSLPIRANAGNASPADIGKFRDVRPDPVLGPYDPLVTMCKLFYATQGGEEDKATGSLLLDYTVELAGTTPATHYPNGYDTGFVSAIGSNLFGGLTESYKLAAGTIGILDFATELASGSTVKYWWYITLAPRTAASFSFQLETVSADVYPWLATDLVTTSDYEVTVTKIPSWIGVGGIYGGTKQVNEFRFAAVNTGDEPKVVAFCNEGMKTAWTDHLDISRMKMIIEPLRYTDGPLFLDAWDSVNSWRTRAPVVEVPDDDEEVDSLVNMVEATTVTSAPLPPLIIPPRFMRR